MNSTSTELVGRAHPNAQTIRVVREKCRKHVQNVQVCQHHQMEWTMGYIATISIAITHVHFRAPHHVHRKVR